MRNVTIACLLAVAASPTLAQSSGRGVDPRAADTTVAPGDPVDRYGGGKGDYTDLGRVRPHTAAFGNSGAYTQTIGSQIGGAIGTTIGPR